MKHRASVVAVFATGPLLALMAACGYCRGHSELALCVLACLEVFAAAGIVAFVGQVAFGWLGVLAVRASRQFIAAVR